MLAFAGLAATCAPRAPTYSPLVDEPVADAGPVCSCELRSWVVAGRGRHVLLDIDCPPPFERLTGVVEFANTAFREDFDWTVDSHGMPRVARMTPGVRVRPIFPGAPERVEAKFEISAETAECLQRDRVFELGYFLLGPNSNSAMRAVCEGCGVNIPEHILISGGPLGDFPGVERAPGSELPADQWQGVGWKRVAP